MRLERRYIPFVSRPRSIADTERETGIATRKLQVLRKEFTTWEIFAYIVLFLIVTGGIAFAIVYTQDSDDDTSPSASPSPTPTPTPTPTPSPSPSPSPAPTPTPTPAPTPTPSDSPGLTTAWIIGIVVASLIFVMGVIMMIVYLKRKRYSYWYRLAEKTVRLRASMKIIARDQAELRRLRLEEKRLRVQLSVSERSRNKVTRGQFRYQLKKYITRRRKEIKGIKDAAELERAKEELAEQEERLKAAEESERLALDARKRLEEKFDRLLAAQQKISADRERILEELAQKGRTVEFLRQSKEELKKKELREQAELKKRVVELTEREKAFQEQQAAYKVTVEQLEGIVEKAKQDEQYGRDQSTRANAEAERAREARQALAALEAVNKRTEDARRKAARDRSKFKRQVDLTEAQLASMAEDLAVERTAAEELRQAKEKSEEERRELEMERDQLRERLEATQKAALGRIAELEEGVARVSESAAGQVSAVRSDRAIYKKATAKKLAVLEKRNRALKESLDAARREVQRLELERAERTSPFTSALEMDDDFVEMDERRGEDALMEEAGE